VELKHVQSGRFNIRHRGRTYAGVIAYLAIFVLLLLLMLHYVFQPVAAAANGADREQRHRLGAIAWLMLSVTLVYLLAGAILVFRIGRFFFPQPLRPRTHTPHIDIWAEAGKRTLPPDDTPPDEQ
jgi:hypothetical protein